MERTLKDQLEELRKENLELSREKIERRKFEKIRAWINIVGTFILILILSVGLIIRI